MPNLCVNIILSFEGFSALWAGKQVGRGGAAEPGGPHHHRVLVVMVLVIMILKLLRTRSSLETAFTVIK